VGRRQVSRGGMGESWTSCVCNSISGIKMKETSEFLIICKVLVRGNRLSGESRAMEVTWSFYRSTRRHLTVRLSCFIYFIGRLQVVTGVAHLLLTCTGVTDHRLGPHKMSGYELSLLLSIPDFTKCTFIGRLNCPSNWIFFA